MTNSNPADLKLFEIKARFATPGAVLATLERALIEGDNLTLDTRQEIICITGLAVIGALNAGIYNTPGTLNVVSILLMAVESPADLMPSIRQMRDEIKAALN